MPFLVTMLIVFWFIFNCRPICLSISLFPLYWSLPLYGSLTLYWSLTILILKWAEINFWRITWHQTVPLELKWLIIVFAATCWDLRSRTWFIYAWVFLIWEKFKLLHFLKMLSFSNRFSNWISNQLVFVSLNQRWYDIADIHRVIFFRAVLVIFGFSLWDVVIWFFVRSVYKWTALSRLLYLFWLKFFCF